MLLQELLERNKQNIRLAYLQEQRRIRSESRQFFMKRRQNDFKLLQSSIRIRSSNLLLSSQSKQSFIIKRNKSSKQTRKPSSVEINGDKFVINKTEIKKKSSGLVQQHTNQQLYRIQQNENILENQIHQNLYPTAQSLHKTNRNSDSQLERKNKTAGNFRGTSMNHKRIFDLPDFLTQKKSLSPFKRPHSTIVRLEEKITSSRQKSIHSRSQMRKQDEVIREKRSRSQQSYQREDQDFFVLNPKQNIFIETDSQFQPKNSKKILHIKSGKINLYQKPKKKTQYVNVFYEYRKSKVKIEKEDIYSPWKKQNKEDHKHIDLSDLLQLHNH